MIKRLLNPLKSSSFFLFGARGTGKSTYLKEEFLSENSLYIDLLGSGAFTDFFRDPDLLTKKLDLKSDYDWVVIDEIQKIPALLDVVHQNIETRNIKFALTGSSARKLRKGSANLLAGRAFINNLYPFSYLELGDLFSLDEVLVWGSMPKILDLSSEQEKFSYLNTYCFTYLKEEILQEQIVRNLNPFSRFLEVAAQVNTEIINYSKLARDAGTTSVTVQNYFEILQDTLIGNMLPPYSRSIRKQQRSSPKFYFIDNGIQRALAKTILIGIHKSTYQYGKLFVNVHSHPYLTPS